MRLVDLISLSMGLMMQIGLEQIFRQRELLLSEWKIWEPLRLLTICIKRC